MNDPIVFLSKKGKKMQNAQIQIGEDEENDNHEKELIENNINEKEKQENLINDELNNIDAENIISNDEEDINLNEKENEKEQNQEEQINNENNDNNTLSTMNYNQLNLIKSHLKLICDKIEQGLNNYHKSKEISKEKNDKTLHNSLSIIEIKPLTKQINHYKQQTENIENELKEVYNINKVNELESNIKKKKNISKKLKKDNITLRKVVSEQSKGIDEYISKFDNTKEINEIKEKIKKEKEELKIKKDNYKETETNLKNQKIKIDNLDKKIKLIKENIEYCKKKQMKELKKNQNQYEIKNDEIKILDEDNIDKLEEEKKKLEQENIQKEKQYKFEIKNQISTIKEMKNKIDIILMKLKSIEQIRKMEELKKKENQRNKMKQIQKSKSPIHIINNNKKQNNQNLRNKNNFNYPIDEIMLTRTPNLKVKEGKFNKPFEINKFNKDINNTNYEQKKLSQIIPEDPNEIFNGKKKDIHEIENQINFHNNNKRQTKTPNFVVNEIENLKNEIQSVLKKDMINDIQIINQNLNINNEHNINRVNSNDKNYKYNEQSTIIATPIIDISDIRKDFEYITDLENNEIILKNISKERIPSSRRKPFDNINFK